MYIENFFDESENEVLLHFLDFDWLDMLDIPGYDVLNILDQVTT